MKATHKSNRNLLASALRRVKASIRSAHAEALKSGPVNHRLLAAGYFENNSEILEEVGREMVINAIENILDQSARFSLGSKACEEIGLPGFDDLPVAIPDGLGNYASLEWVRDANIQFALDTRDEQIAGLQKSKVGLIRFREFRSELGVSEDMALAEFRRLTP